MAFVKEKATTPNHIGDIEIGIYNPDPSGIEQKAIRAKVHVVMDDSTERVREFDLSDVLTAQQIATLNSLGDSIRTKAKSDILPG